MSLQKKALFIVKKLHDAGYISYYAGGWVRDLLLELPSDDIDIATNATPQILQSLFPKTIPIGIAFGIILVMIDESPFEVATFRKDSDYQDGRHPSHVEFSTAYEDAKRRDFTINGMFFDPINNKVLDYVEGQKDIKRKIIRAIGDPQERILEDKLRMVRAIRLAARFDFTIEENTKKAILLYAKDLFPSVAIERVWQELFKMAAYKNFQKALLMLHDFGLLQEIFPELKKCAREEIENLTKNIEDFPKNTPVILQIIQLFPNKNLTEQIELCKYLKLSNNELKSIVSFFTANQLIQENNVPNDKWAHFYADKNTNLSLLILSKTLPLHEQESFLQEHEKRQKKLFPYIVRIQNATPLVTAKHLMQENITPGKKMGLLLKEAEKISINNNITDAEKVIIELKKMDLWTDNL